MKIKVSLHGPWILEIGLDNVKILNGNWRVLIHVVFYQYLLKVVKNKNFRF